MTIAIFLQNIHGVKRAEALDPDYSLAHLWPIEDSSFPLLQYIDPYGNAVFNRAQMPQIIKELETLRAKATSEKQKRVITEIIDLAATCRDRPHTFLNFRGD